MNRLSRTGLSEPGQKSGSGHRARGDVQNDRKTANRGRKSSIGEHERERERDLKKPRLDIPLDDMLSVLEISPDGAQIALGTAGVLVYSVPYSEVAKNGPAVKWKDLPLCIHRGHAAGINSIAWSTDSTTFLSTSDDQRSILWDHGVPDAVQVFRGHRSVVTDACFLEPNNIVVTCSLDRSLCYWSVYTGLLLDEDTGHINSVTAVAASYDGSMLVTGCVDGLARIWSVRSGNCLATLARSDEHLCTPILNAGFTPNADYVWALHADGWLELYEVISKVLIKVWLVDNDISVPRPVKFYGNLILIAASYGIACLDIIRGELVHKLRFQGGVNAFSVYNPQVTLEFDPTGTYIVIEHEGTLHNYVFEDLPFEMRRAALRTQDLNNASDQHQETETENENGIKHESENKNEIGNGNGNETEVGNEKDYEQNRGPPDELKGESASNRNEPMDVE